MKHTLTSAIFAVVLVLTLISGAAYANNRPMELTAETIEYDTNTGIVTAVGSVRLVQDGTVLTGSEATYNTKTQAALLKGGVKAVHEDATLTAEQVQAYDNNHLAASGNVVLVKGTSTVVGSRVDYYADRAYAQIISGAKLTTADGTMTADTLEAFFDEDRAIGSGNVRFVSDVHNVDARADQATYYGSQSGPGKIVLSGNARAVQDGNVLTGNQLVIHLQDRAVQAQGRTKLVITPE